jgi:hypothetical protein
MIEVKGKIHNQLIAILIDSGASHSCNDPWLLIIILKIVYYIILTKLIIIN